MPVFFGDVGNPMVSATLSTWYGAQRCRCMFFNGSADQIQFCRSLVSRLAAGSWFCMFFNVQNFHSPSLHTTQQHGSRHSFCVGPGMRFLTWEAVGWEVVFFSHSFQQILFQSTNQSQLKSSYVAEACCFFGGTPVYNLNLKLICRGVGPEQIGSLSLCFFCHTQVMHSFVETSRWPLALALYDELHSRVLVRHGCDCCFVWLFEDVGELKLGFRFDKLLTDCTGMWTAHERWQWRIYIAMTIRSWWGGRRGWFQVLLRQGFVPLQECFFWKVKQSSYSARSGFGLHKPIMNMIQLPNWLVFPGDSLGVSVGALGQHLQCQTQDRWRQITSLLASCAAELWKWNLCKYSRDKDGCTPNVRVLPWYL